MLEADSECGYTTQTLLFSRAFTLGASSEVYPPGTYLVETGHKAWYVSGHRATCRTSTVLIIPTPGGTLHRQVSAVELDEAIAQDAQQSIIDGTSENPDRGLAERRTEEVE